MAAGLNREKQPPKIAAFGHRGARAILPENTLARFEYALSTGTDVYFLLTIF